MKRPFCADRANVRAVHAAVNWRRDSQCSLFLEPGGSPVIGPMETDAADDNRSVLDRASHTPTETFIHVVEG
jgi:hypothetical protein